MSPVSASMLIRTWADERNRRHLAVADGRHGFDTEEEDVARTSHDARSRYRRRADSRARKIALARANAPAICSSSAGHDDVSR